MQPSSSTREVYPHRELGTAMLILGVALFLIAILLGSDCQSVSNTSFPGGPYAPASNYCYYPYAGAAIALGVLGFTLLLLGVILIVMRAPTASYGTPTPAFVPGYYPPAPPPPPPAQMVACKSCGRIYVLGQFSFCPSCGTKLGS